MNKIAKSSWNKFIVIILLILFGGPMLGAWWFYYHPATFSSNSVNQGKLIQPPLNFRELTLVKSDGTLLQYPQHKWIFLYVAPTPCNQVCQKNLYYMRQIWVALGKDMDRVQRLVVNFPTSDRGLEQQIEQQYSGTLYAHNNLLAINRFFGNLNPTAIASANGTFYLVDPVGNVMMFYPANVAPKGIYKDLTRLLKVSGIG